MDYPNVGSRGGCEAPSEWSSSNSSCQSLLHTCILETIFGHTHTHTHCSLIDLNQIEAGWIYSICTYAANWVEIETFYEFYKWNVYDEKLPHRAIRKTEI